MSKISLKSSSSGTATFTIESPATNTDRVLTIPDAAGTVFVGGQALSATTGSFSGNVTLGSSVLATPTGSAPAYLCRAWVNFDGTGTVAIRASGNVSSITDNGTGNYTINFTTAMPDANYAMLATLEPSTVPGVGATFYTVIGSDNANPLTRTTSGAQVRTAYVVSLSGASTAWDSQGTHVALFR